jgi:hypothetical protein
VKKNFVLKGRSWMSTVIEMALPVALMCLLIWIRLEITTEHEPAKSYIDSPKNNPTWFGDNASTNLELVPPEMEKLLAPFCKKNTGVCPEVFSHATWSHRKEHYLGMALDGLLQLHMALYNQRIGIIGSGGDDLQQFIERLPGYKGYVIHFSTDEEFRAYTANPAYGFQEAHPQLFGAIHVNDFARPVTGGFNGTYDIVFELNATGPGSLDFNGATGVNTKLVRPVNKLQQNVKMNIARIFWSGGLFTSTGVPLETGGLVDLQTLVYAWIYNATGAFECPSSDELQKKRCVCKDIQVSLQEDFRKSAD